MAGKAGKDGVFADTVEGNVDFAAGVEAFMDAMDLKSVVPMGSSSGGYVAQQVNPTVTIQGRVHKVHAFLR